MYCRNARKGSRLALFRRYLQYFYVRRGVTKPTVANGARSLTNQFDDVFRPVHVKRALLEIGFLSDHRFPKVLVSSRIILTAHPDDIVRLDARYVGDAKLCPLAGFPAFPVNVRKLFQTDLRNWVVLVYVDRKTIEPNQKFLGILSLGLSFGDLFRLKLATAIGNLGCTVDQSGNADTRSSP